MSYRVIIPIYKEISEIHEVYAAASLKTFYAPDRLIFIYPSGSNFGTYRGEFSDAEFLSIPSSYLESRASYNRLLLSRWFYSMFSTCCDYILIHQTDAITLSNDVERFISLSPSYIGAPWPNGNMVSTFFRSAKLRRLFGRRVRVGNGGLSLRRVNDMIMYLTSNWTIAKLWRNNEDEFFSRNFRNQLEIPSESVALCFSREKLYSVEEVLGIDGLPMGLHGWHVRHVDIYQKMISDHFRHNEQFNCYLQIFNRYL